MDYREFPPPPRLARLVACIWTLEGHADEMAGAVQPVLPDGRPELVVHFGDPFDRLNPDGRAERQPALIYAGQLTGQLELRPTGRIAVLGIRFHPDGAAGLTGVPQFELAGQTLAVGDLSAPLASALRQVRDATGSPAEAVDLIAARLSPWADRARLDPCVRSSVDAIRRYRGHVSISALAASTGSTPRHLERRFKHLIGISPKRLARIARFQHALQILESEVPGSIGTFTAAMCGYADQAHFVRDFRDLAGCPPGAHLMRRAELTGFFRDRSY
jgi:AraC-like DNA-binding protein